MRFSNLKIISIEVGDSCNLKHRHKKCPASIRILDKRYHLLTVDDIKAIIMDSYNNGFNGEIAFHYFNEPLLYKDKMFKIMDECKYAKFLLWTNGELLKANIEENDFLNRFNKVVISNYGGKSKYFFYLALQSKYPNIKLILNYPTLNDLDERKKIYENTPSNIYGCTRPFLTEIPIDCYGNVHLCCMDWNNSCKIGNVIEKPLSELILSTEFSKIEDSINRDFLDLEHCPDICKKCNSPLRGVPQFLSQPV